MNAHNKLAFVAVLALVGGCRFDGDFLFDQPIPGVPGVIDIKTPDGRPVVPFELDPYSPGLKATLTAFDGADVSLPEDGDDEEFPNTIVVNEVLTNGNGLDVSCDGDLDDDANAFVELVNSGSSSVDLLGFEVRFGGGLFHTFDAMSLAPNQSVVVFGGLGTSTCVPAGSTFLAANGTMDDLDGVTNVRVLDAAGDLSSTMSVDSPNLPAGVSVNRTTDGQFNAPVIRHDRTPSALRILIPGATVYGEVGPVENSLPSGATLEFQGTGGDVCVFIDPEVVFWSQSISQTTPSREYRFPDNVYDDGDLDVRIGQSVYYRGTPGVSMGGFEVQYTDDLGNDVEINLVQCQNTNDDNDEPYAGRGAPEYCTVRNTQVGVNYTVAMEAYSLPRDDARLSFGVVLAAGDCDKSDGSLIRAVSPPTPGVTIANAECVIRGEGLPPVGDAEVYFGYEAGRSIEGSEEFENAFCTGQLFNYCLEEIQTIRGEGLTCDYEGVETAADDESRRCFCGDRNDTPNAGAIR